jgi:hypothetical protein
MRGDTACQYVVVEHSEKPIDKEIISLGQNDDHQVETNVPNRLKLRERLSETPELSGTLGRPMCTKLTLIYNDYDP